jgi:hypothetical protein
MQLSSGAWLNLAFLSPSSTSRRRLFRISPPRVLRSCILTTLPHSIQHHHIPRTEFSCLLSCTYMLSLPLHIFLGLSTTLIPTAHRHHYALLFSLHTCILFFFSSILDRPFPTFHAFSCLRTSICFSMTVHATPIIHAYSLLSPPIHHIPSRNT